MRGAVAVRLVAARQARVAGQASLLCGCRRFVVVFACGGVCSGLVVVVDGQAGKEEEVGSTHAARVLGHLLLAGVGDLGTDQCVDHVEHGAQVGVVRVLAEHVHDGVHVPAADLGLAVGDEALLRRIADQHVAQCGHVVR